MQSHFFMRTIIHIREGISSTRSAGDCSWCRISVEWVDGIEIEGGRPACTCWSRAAYSVSAWSESGSALAGGGDGLVVIRDGVGWTCRAGKIGWIQRWGWIASLVRVFICCYRCYHDDYERDVHGSSLMLHLIYNLKQISKITILDYKKLLISSRQLCSSRCRWAPTISGISWPLRVISAWGSCLMLTLACLRAGRFIGNYIVCCVP